MMRKSIPTFSGFKVDMEERYAYAREGRIFRLGIKMNTPEFCNWKCPYCYAGSRTATDRPRLMHGEELAGDDLFHDDTWPDRMKGWIAQAQALGLRAVTLNGTFEPTMSRHLVALIDYCREQGLLVTLVTNGSLLTDTLLAELIRNEVFILTKINVPLVEDDDPRYEQFCHIQQRLSGVAGDPRDSYETQKKIIYGLRDAGLNVTDEPGRTRVGVESVITTINMAYLPELVGQLRAMNFYSHIEVTKLQGFAHHHRDLLPTYDEVHDVFDAILAQDIAAGYEAWEPRPPYVAAACHENLFRLDLHANGTVKPCPGVETTLGNLNDQPLADLLAHPALATLRNLEDHIQGDCRDCDLFRDRACFAGCRGTTYQVLKARGYSDFDAWTGSDPSCWRVGRVLDNGVTTADLFPAPEPA